MQDRLIKFENFDDYWTETSDVIDEEVALGGTFVSSVEKHIVEKAIMYKLANAVIYGANNPQSKIAAEEICNDIENC